MTLSMSQQLQSQQIHPAEFKSLLCYAKKRTSKYASILNKYGSHESTGTTQAFNLITFPSPFQTVTNLENP